MIPRISGLSQKHFLRTFIFLSQIQILGQDGDKETNFSKMQGGGEAAISLFFSFPLPPSSPSYPRSSFQMGFLKKPLPPTSSFSFSRILTFEIHFKNICLCRRNTFIWTGRIKFFKSLSYHFFHEEFQPTEVSPFYKYFSTTWLYYILSCFIMK